MQWDSLKEFRQALSPHFLRHHDVPLLKFLTSPAIQGILYAVYGHICMIAVFPKADA